MNLAHNQNIKKVKGFPIKFNSLFTGESNLRIYKIRVKKIAFLDAESTGPILRVQVLGGRRGQGHDRESPRDC